jgi:Tfp pilus assembly protein PilW
MATANNDASSSRRQHEGGYSLPEALIAALVLTIVLLAIYMVYDTSQQDYARGVARADVQQNIRVALDSMARELRMAGYAASNIPNADCVAPPCAVTVLTSSSVTFQAEIDGDTQTNKVIYTFVPPTNLSKPCDSSDPTTVGRIIRSAQAWSSGAWSPATPVPSDVAQCVTSLTMTYYDGSGATPTPAASVRRITIAIVGIENIRGFGARTYTLTSDVRLRNL